MPLEVRPLVESLNGLLNRLAQALENERRFTADAAHELRTPLAALKTQVQLLQVDASSGQRARDLDGAVRAVDRMSHPVSQLLALSRAEAVSESAAGRRVDLTELAASAVEQAGPVARAAGVSLTLDASTHAVEVEGDGETLAILLRNLVDNALRYGGHSCHVSVGAARRENGAELWVENDGPGIAPDERERVLERFHRGRGVRSGGSGLGLSIARRIAALHGGRIDIDTGRGGRGTRISMHLPRQRTLSGP